MNIQELEISNIRGIKHLQLAPRGKNIVIWGLNGSGKSAVVDAVDFLLTGRISRLIGEGTGGMSLTKYGPHIDHAPEEASVWAKVTIPYFEETIEIKRCMASPTSIEITCSVEHRPYVEFILWSAERGQHVLARREILKYIHAQPKTRAERILDLLKLSEIEDVRAALITVKNKAADIYRQSKIFVSTCESQVNTTIGQKKYSQQAIIEFINTNRSILGGKPMSEIDSDSMQKEVRKPTDYREGKTINPSLFAKDIKNILDAMSNESMDEIEKDDKELRKLLTEFKSDANSLKLAFQLRLAELGLKLIDEDGSCPLCDIEWESGKLALYLEEKITKGKGFSAQYTDINRLSNAILNQINNTLASLKKVVADVSTVGIVGLDTEKAALLIWLGNMESLATSLRAVLDKYPIEKFNTDSVKRMGAPEFVEQHLSRISDAVKGKVPETTPELNAWTALVRLGENLKALENATKKLQIDDLASKRANSLNTAFLASRDHILGALYEEIRDRFVELYIQLHRSDEGQFKADIHPDGAGLDFEVEFYGHGQHPPQALHSEGHQDSMGICLYLALVERLNRGLINLVVLDDVVMSVDIEHRRQLCGLLAKAFPEKQFIITTHDRTWATQLKSEKVVTGKNLIEFHDWCIETGPRVNSDVILWDQIAGSLTHDDVPTAAAQLRRGLECFFGEACDTLCAPVKYNSRHKWELGDFLLAAIKQYRYLLSLAIKSANSWDKREQVKELVEKQTVANALIMRSQAEEWAINDNVHYNNWANFVKEDFSPVVEAFKDLCSLFVCSKCGAAIQLISAEKVDVSVRCLCGEENWNLVEKRAK
ncbi:AAA family ATPase [Dehalococcoides mccartyi]|uniref:AAA family ATPase n=1 Tax=Dehalococcoides mccartyi TaxID=61435 RepID=UPI001A0AD39B|nr:AAA family ATPase [Dehalococcoides mccartyi]MBF4482491.1 AAA family ATPase [Dehalococcoides mccartyi]MBJ7532510.1 AAA family ATPase [Dehalococcoides mccartyi]